MPWKTRVFARQSLWALAALLAAVAAGLLTHGSSYYVGQLLACQVPWAKLDQCLAYLILNEEGVNFAALAGSAGAAVAAGATALYSLRHGGG